MKDEDKTKVAQDSDIKDREGTQPKKYYKGLAKSTKEKRAAHFERKTKMDDDNPAAYTPAPGDKDAKTKPSKHTLKYKKMYGEEYLQELFDKPYPFTLKKSTDGKEWNANLTLPDKSSLGIHILRGRKDNWDVVFARDGSIEVTGKGDQMKIFATVMAAIKEFIEKEKLENIQYIEFDAQKTRTDDGKLSDDIGSRARLYHTMAKKFAPKEFRVEMQKGKMSVNFKMINTTYNKTNEEYELNEEAKEGLKKKAEKSGIAYSILKKVYDRGVAAWRTGHRPGTTPQQWGYARVNSFITKGKGTWGKADKDLASQVRKEEVEISELKKSTYLSYEKKASDDVTKRYNKYPRSDKEEKKLQNRVKGVARAHVASWTAKEEVEIDENFEKELKQKRDEKRRGAIREAVKNYTGNPVAKNLNKYNKPSVQTDKKKDAKRGYEKHKGKVQEMNVFQKYMQERFELQEKKGSDYDIYHKTFSSAVQHAMEQVEKKYKLAVDPDDWFNKVSSGPRKPSSGKTNSYIIDLIDPKTEETSRKRIHMQVYNMDNKSYELNMYVQ